MFCESFQSDTGPRIFGHNYDCGFFWLSQIALGEGERMESPMKENLPSSDQFDALLQVCHTRVQLQKNKSHHSCEIAATSMLLMFTDRTSEKIGSL
jgi:hypothetical protein